MFGNNNRAIIWRQSPVIIAICALTFFIGMGYGKAKATATASAEGVRQDDPMFFKPMSFSAYYEHAGNAAAHYVLARGVITKSTPSEFLAYYMALSKTEDHVPAEIWFHSPGGDLRAALEMGKIIRNLRLSTLVGGKYTRFHSTTEDATVVENSYCLSACAWSFLGGRVRVVAEDNAFGVHQFYTSENQGTEAGAQVTMAILATYLDEMQINRGLLDLAAVTPANKITYLLVDEARNLNIDNAEQGIGQWEIKATKAGQIMGWLKQKLPRTDDQAIVVVLADIVPQSLLFTITYTTKHSLRSQADITEMFRTMNQKPRIYPGTEFAPSKDVAVLSGNKWINAAPGVHRTVVPVVMRNARLLCRQEYFTFDPDWPHCCMDAAPAIIIPTKGLSSIISAIDKQGPAKMPRPGKR